MRVFKNLDYFRKVSPEHTKPTVIGGLVSLCSLTVIVVLFMYEINDFARTKIKKDTYVGAIDRQGDEFISMNIDITFPHAPCFMIEVEQRSSVSAQSRDEVNKHLFKRRLDKQGEPLDQVDPNFDSSENVIQLLSQAMENDEQCNIKGKIILERVTGQVLLNFNNKIGYINELQRSKPDIANKISFSHVVNSLTFGDVSQQVAVRKRFGNNEHTAFDMMEFIDDALYAEDNSSKDYFYFYKLVPHVFIDEVHLEQYSSYSYSLNHNAKQAQLQNFPQITMIYDFAPVNMKITKQQRDLSRFLVNLCAIIGGVFVIFGLINRFLLSVKETFAGEGSR